MGDGLRIGFGAECLKRMCGVLGRIFGGLPLDDVVRCAVEVEAKDFEVGEIDSNGFVVEDAPSDIVGEAPFYHGGEGFFDAAEFEHGGGID